MGENFVHLHVHTMYSLLDGMTKIKALVAKIKEDGQKAVAITDHGVMFGAVSFYDECKKQGVKPIIGCEMYITSESRTNKAPDKYGEDYYHLILLVKNETGYKNLCRLVTRSNTEGFYGKPRIDFELLSQFHEGLICLSACLAGEIPKAIMRKDLDSAKQIALKYKELFGEDFYLEIQNHGIAEEAEVSYQLLGMSQELGIKLVCTNDCHYLNSEDSEAHEWLLCMQTGKTMDEPHMKYDGDYSVKTEAEMRELFPSIPQAFDNTVEVAEKCNFDFVFAEKPADYRMPKVIIPEEYGTDYFRYLSDETWKGYEKRYPEGHPYREQAKPRLEYELSVIKNMGFAEYFLDTRKTILWSRENNILVGPGRGCQIKGGLVFTTTGIKEIQDVKIGDYVIDCEGHRSMVKKTFTYDVNENVTEISAIYGGTVTFTQDHKFLICRCIPETNKHYLAQGYRYSDNRPMTEPEWVKASSIQQGDWVMQPIPKIPYRTAPRYDLAQYAPKSSTKHTITSDKIICGDFSKMKSLGVNIQSVVQGSGVNKTAVSNFLHSKKNILKDNEEKILQYLDKCNVTIEEWRDMASGIAIPRNIKLDANLAYLLGYYIADGWTHHEEVCFAYNKITEERYKNVLTEKIQQVFGNIGITYRKTRGNCFAVNIQSGVIAEFFRTVMNGDAHSKNMPTIIKESSIDIKKAFLRGAFDGDGSYREKTRAKYTTVNRRLAYDIKYLCLTLGIPAIVRISDRKDHFGERRIYDTVVPATSRSEEVFPIFETKGKPNNQLYYVDDNYIYMRVRKINTIHYTGTVHDISVDTSAEPSYCTESCIVHNSGAGSCLNYCLGITDLEPLRYNLLFERFLNPERISMPDIDVDYQYDRKDDVIRSEADSNGHDKFCKIQTLGSLKAKGVIKDVLRVGGYPCSLGNEISKMIPDDPKMTLTEATKLNPDIEAKILSEGIQKEWEIALKLEGLKKSSGSHACGHIPTPVPCEELFPCRVDSESGYLVCEYDMAEAEHLGNLKKDLLMLRNLTIISVANKAIKKHYGIDVPMYTDEVLNDPLALKLFWDSDTDGIFQFESEGMRKFMKELKPDCFEDIIAGVSLYRPGPMDYIPKYVEGKHNPASITYDCPELEPILKPTYGVIVYQEQVMAIVRILAGFSMGRADLIRKAMGRV